MKRYLLFIAIVTLPSPTLGTESGLTQQADGPALYREHCARCHGSLEKTWIPDRRTARIASAIRNLGRMASVRHLTGEQIAAIADALKSGEDTLNGP